MSSVPVASSDGEANLALSDARRRRAGQSGVAHAWTLPRLGALVHQLQVYTCSLLEASGSGIVHVLALKLGNKTLINLPLLRRILEFYFGFFSCHSPSIVQFSFVLFDVIFFSFHFDVHPDHGKR